MTTTISNGPTSRQVLTHNDELSAVRSISRGLTASGHSDLWDIGGYIPDLHTDNSNADNSTVINDYIQTGARYLKFPRGVFRIKNTLSFVGDGNRGQYIIEGAGSGLYNDDVPADPMGTILLWDGPDDVPMFEFGNGPLYIGGVLQGWENAQFGNIVRNLTIHTLAACEKLFYVHDQDSFQSYSVFVDGRSRTDVRGVFDFRGAVNNIRLDQITVVNVPCGYGARFGDASTNSTCFQTFMESVGLGFWIADTNVYEDIYHTGHITIRDTTFEGLYSAGKFIVTNLSTDASAGVTSITVASSSGIAIDDPVYIGRGHENFEMNVVDSINGNTISLKYTTDYAHSNGDIVKFGNIGIHIGKSSDSMGRSKNIIVDRCMFDRFGCGVDVHNCETIEIRQPIFTSLCSCGFYFDGNTQNIQLFNPNVFATQNSDWLLFNITNRGDTWDFIWIGGGDKSGKTVPFVNSQGECGGFFIGDLSQVIHGLPPYFRGMTFDATNGITIEETDGALGIRYKFGGNINFRVLPDGTVYTNNVEVTDTVTCGNTVDSRWGIIITSDSGNKKYQVHVDDSGVLSTVDVT